MSNNFFYLLTSDEFRNFEAWVESSTVHEGFFLARITHGQNSWEGLARNLNRALGFAFQKMADWLIKGGNAN